MNFTVMTTGQTHARFRILVTLIDDGRHACRLLEEVTGADSVASVTSTKLVISRDGHLIRTRLNFKNVPLEQIVFVKMPISGQNAGNSCTGQPRWRKSSRHGTGAAYSLQSGYKHCMARQAE